MKLLFVLENYLPHIGGVEVVFRSLCEGLVKRGHDVSIVTHRIKGTKRLEIINGVKVYRVNCFNSRYWFTFLAIPKVLKLAKRMDIIHTTTFNGAFPAWVGAKLRKKPSVITIHEVWVGKWRKLTEMNWINAGIHSLLERLIYWLKFSKYVCVSKATKKELLRVGVKEEKTEIVYNGLNYQKWNPDEYNGREVRDKLDLRGKFVYLFSGRPGPSKGLEYLIKAVPIISKIIPNSKLLAIISRDRTYEKRYNYILKLIKRMGVKDKVIVHAPIKYGELPNYVKAADCIVVPSLTEGFGFAAAEACAMGKPVVASNVASLPEVVSGRFVLVKPRSVDGIAKGVEMIYKHQEMKNNLKRFELKENIEGYLRVYVGLLR